MGLADESMIISTPDTLSTPSRQTLAANGRFMGPLSHPTSRQAPIHCAPARVHAAASPFRQRSTSPASVFRLFVMRSVSTFTSA